MCTYQIPANMCYLQLYLCCVQYAIGTSLRWKGVDISASFQHIDCLILASIYHVTHAAQIVILLHESQEWRKLVREEGELWRDLSREIVHDIGFI